MERERPKQPMRSGSTEKLEVEYRRHGTQCLIGNFEVATGKMLAPQILDTRTTNDFLKNIQELVMTDPNGEWIFIADQLNTHKSDPLVRWIAQQIQFQGDLGKNGKACKDGRGILKSIKTRMEFLENKTHRIRFLYTPKHCSWMNQIELWFSGISRRYLKRTSFESIVKLKEGILNYINVCNLTARAYKWAYSGQVLQS